VPLEVPVSKPGELGGKDLIDLTAQKLYCSHDSG
jgi:hypothetical protein